MTLQDQPRHGRGGSLIQARQDVAVGVHRDGDGRVPEPFTDDLRWDAGSERRRGVTVAQVVQTDGRQPCGANVLPEPIGEPLGVNRRAVRMDEDQPVVLVGLRDVHGVVGNHARLADSDAGGVQVDVDPAQPEQFTAAHAGGGAQQPGGVLATTLDMGQEGAELETA